MPDVQLTWLGHGTFRQGLHVAADGRRAAAPGKGDRHGDRGRHQQRTQQSSWAKRQSVTHVSP